MEKPKTAKAITFAKLREAAAYGGGRSASLDVKDNRLEALWVQGGLLTIVSTKGTVTYVPMHNVVYFTE